MRIPHKDDPGGDREGRLPRADVLEVLRRHDVAIELGPTDVAGALCCTLVSDSVAEVHWLPDPVGGLMVKHLARKFDIETVQFYYFRQLDEQNAKGPLQ
jgi:hypothetical protein